MTAGQEDLSESQDMRVVLALIRTIEAEKRTHLAELRTGIGILTIPLSLLTILIATSKYYDFTAVLFFIIALIAGIIAMFFIGALLVIRALRELKTDYGRRDAIPLPLDAIITNHDE